MKLRPFVFDVFRARSAQSTRFEVRSRRPFNLSQYHEALFVSCFRFDASSLRAIIPTNGARQPLGSIGALVGGAWAGSVAGVGVSRGFLFRGWIGGDAGARPCRVAVAVAQTGTLGWLCRLNAFFGSSHSAVLLSCSVALNWPAAISLRTRGPRLVAPNVPCPATASLVEDH